MFMFIWIIFIFIYIICKDHFNFIWIIVQMNGTFQINKKIVQMNMKQTHLNYLLFELQLRGTVRAV